MKSLLPYQIEGVEFASAHRNTLIADEMGLGKTIQAIAYINANEIITSVLIICPASLKLNWFAEIDEWLNRKETVSISIIQFDSLKKIQTQPFDLIIIDEAHYIKNEKTLRSKETKRLVKNAKHVLMLTGTPCDKPLELWPLLQILNPEKWDPAGWFRKKKTEKKVKVGAGEGAGFWDYAKRYCGARKVIFNTKSFWDFTGATNLDELNRKLKETGMIRRLKKDVLPQLPPKIHQIIALSALKIEERYLPDLNEDNFDESIRRLKADKVAFTEWSLKRKEQGVMKIPYVIKHVLECIEGGSEKIILFAHHKEVIEGLREGLVFTGCIAMTSEMSGAERQGVVDCFIDDPNCKVILGSPAVMGTGWTLTVSAHVIWAELEPTPKETAQGNDRAHRIGQTAESVLCQYLVFDRTLDARICKILVKKMKVVDKLLNHVQPYCGACGKMFSDNCDFCAGREPPKIVEPPKISYPDCDFCSNPAMRPCPIHS